MAQTDIFRRFLDAGMAFTAMTQARAEEIVRDLTRAGEVQGEQVQSLVGDLVDRSRENTERLFEQVRGEVRDQVRNLGLATQGDIERIETKIDGLSTTGRRSSGTSRSTRSRPSAKKAARKAAGTAKKSTRKTTGTAKKSARKAAGTAKKAARKAAGTAKKSTRRATGTTKKTARKATGSAKKTARKATRTARKTTAKRAPARKSIGRNS